MPAVTEGRVKKVGIVSSPPIPHVLWPPLTLYLSLSVCLGRFLKMMMMTTIIMIIIIVMIIIIIRIIPLKGPNTHTQVARA